MADPKSFKPILDLPPGGQQSGPGRAPPPPGSVPKTGGPGVVPPPPGGIFDPTSIPAIRVQRDDFNFSFALSLIDALQRPPPMITYEYIEILEEVATFMNLPSAPALQSLSVSTGARVAWDQKSFPETQAGLASSNVMSPVMTGQGYDSQEKVRNAVNRARNEILEMSNKVNAFVPRAKNAGFAPPENPFAFAMSFNVNRRGFYPPNVTGEQGSRIATNVKAYVKLLEAEKTGQLNLDRNVNKAAQLSVASLSLDGFGGTGNTSVDLAKLLPDLDSIKRQKASEALAVFDFRRRIPKVLFTAFYAPDGVPRGVIVGWKKVADASGYVVKRTSVFDGKVVTYALTNEDIKRDTAKLAEYVKAWILSFYDNIQSDIVLSFLDTDVPPHRYFKYTIQAYQLQNENPGSMFDVETAPVFLSGAQKRSIRDQLESLDPNKVDAKGGSLTLTPDTISPWPVLSHVLLGDAKYDWVLAALNVRNSINRGDTRTETRNYSYLSAQLQNLFLQADVGKLVVPKSKNVSAILKNIEDAIAKYGVNQVIQNVLQETGALYYFEGKDPADNSLFRTVNTGNASSGGLIEVVAAAIDPETATMNLKVLASNMPQLLSGQFVSIKDSLGSKSAATKTATIAEIDIPSEFDSASDQRAEDEIQYLSKLGNLENSVDLTKAEGIATFMRTVRIFSDIGPNRGAPLTNRATKISPDSVSKPGSQSPALSSVQPVALPTTILASANVNLAYQEQKSLVQSLNEDVKLQSDSIKVDPTGKGGKGKFQP